MPALWRQAQSCSTGALLLLHQWFFLFGNINMKYVEEETILWSWDGFLRPSSEGSPDEMTYVYSLASQSTFSLLVFCIFFCPNPKKNTSSPWHESWDSSFYIGILILLGETKKAKWQAQLDDGLVEFSSISSLATVDELMAGFLKLAHGAHTEDQEGFEKNPGGTKTGDRNG